MTMGKLEVGMKFSNLRHAFQFLGIENEYFGQQKNKELKLSEFCNWHKINKHSLVIDEVFTERKTLYKEQKVHTLEDLKDNFISLYNKFGRVLTYNEFVENTSISLTTYCSKLNLSGQVYDSLIEMYLSKDIKDDYRNSMIEFRKKLGSDKGVMNFIKYTDDDLKTNFKKVFDYYYQKYNSYPTRKIFNYVSEIDESVYRSRYKKKWSELCEYYGYKTTIKFKAEHLALEMCKDLFGVDYIPQKTFNWLVNDKNHHLFCDGYFEGLRLVVEFDGAVHRVPVKIYGGQKGTDRQNYNDSVKDKLLREHNITVIRIDSRLKWYTEEGMLEIIKTELSKNNMSYDLLKVS